MTADATLGTRFFLSSLFFRSFSFFQRCPARCWPAKNLSRGLNRIKVTLSLFFSSPFGLTNYSGKLPIWLVRKFAKTLQQQCFPSFFSMFFLQNFRKRVFFYGV